MPGPRECTGRVMVCGVVEQPHAAGIAATVVCVPDDDLLDKYVVRAAIRSYLRKYAVWQC